MEINSSPSQKNRRRADLSDDEQLDLREIADRVAENSIRKVFAMLGVDVDDPKSVEEFRSDLRFAGRLRKVTDHLVIAAIGVIAAGICASFWAGLVSKMNGKP